MRTIALALTVSLSACFTPTFEDRLADLDASDRDGSHVGPGLDASRSDASRIDAGRSDVGGQGPDIGFPNPRDAGPGADAGYLRDGGANHDASCQGSCQDKECGDDGCGTSCGNCSDGKVCTNKGTCLACAPAKVCSDACCGDNQACVADRCVTCGCGNMVCGKDACGNDCGPCPYPKACSVTGQCVNSCNCNNKSCGDDGCGHSCGSCSIGYSCANGQCVCSPSCYNRKCGSDGCGGTCGACQTGYDCDPSGQCLKQTCVPACGKDQSCDDSQTPPVCVEICNPPTGCKSLERCDAVHKKCLPEQCGGKDCDFGQGCFDPTTEGPGNLCTCLPQRQDASGTWLSDTCADYGLACQWDWYHPQAAKCGLPREFEQCTKTTGCDTGLECVNLYGSSICMQACNNSSECKNTLTSCQAVSVGKRHCYYNFCAYPESQPADRARYFKPCDSSSKGDGICLPAVSSDSNGNPIDIGLCYQTGSAAGICDAAADRTNRTMLCSQGQYCLGVQPDPANPAGQPGFCAQACNAAPSPDPVATCTSGTCVDMSGAADGTVQLARLGLCLPGCSLYGTDSCPADALGNSCGCAPAPPYDGTGYCWPLSPTPGQPGAACTLGTGKDSRNPCGDRLYCTDLGQGGECLGWCDTNTCPAGAACGSCKPSPSQCVQAANTVGICIP